MRLVCISDTHNLHNEVIVPNGDVLIHAGDATNYGSAPEISAFAEWFNDLPHKHKIFTAGNHDSLYQRELALADTFIPNLHDKSIEIEGLEIYGSSWQPEFFNWAFNLPRGKAIADKWKLIPEGTDILITHGPPYSRLDAVESGGMVGCWDLLQTVKRIKPKLHIFGHVHHSYGKMEKLGIAFVNASICDEAYETSNKPIVIDI
jgi:Icc-related predicted phosphoesterase